MEKRKNEPDNTFWSASQTGFEFDDQLLQVHDLESTVNQSESGDLNELDLSKCVRLTGSAEHISPKKYLAHIFHAVDDSHSSKFVKSLKPFDNQQKIQFSCIDSKPQQTIQRMILGFDYCLTKFKKLKEKSELLKEAVESHDGNVILEVVLFLRETLKKSLFQRELIIHHDAVNIYLAYLEDNHEIDELSNTLLLLGKAEDAAMFKYEVAVSVENPERRLKWIENCLSTHFQPEVTDIFYQQSVEEHKKLLAEQLSLKCASADEETTLHFEKLCGKQSVIDTSVLSTTIFCLLHFYNTDEKSRFSVAEKFKLTFNLSKKQYMWAALRALAIAHRWKDLDNLFISKNWLSSLKLQSCIHISKILDVFFEAKAPREVLNKYILCVENEQEKLQFAKQYECHNIVIEIFRNNKDRKELIKYQSSLVPHMDDFLYALKVLNDPSIKWKN